MVNACVITEVLLAPPTLNSTAASLAGRSGRREQPARSSAERARVTRQAGRVEAAKARLGWVARERRGHVHVGVGEGGPRPSGLAPCLQHARGAEDAGGAHLYWEGCARKGKLMWGEYGQHKGLKPHWGLVEVK